MKTFSAILVPLDGSRNALRSLGCAAWLSSSLGASLHVLNVAASTPGEQTPEALGIPEKYRSLITIHGAAGRPSEEIFKAVDEYGIDLIVLTAYGQSREAQAERALAAVDPSKIIGHVAREIIEGSDVPVLLLPPGYEEALPWRSALVPISGEAATDESLTLALRLAEALDFAVTVAHVVNGSAESPDRRAGMGHSDEVHHEYPLMLDEFIARACPMCTAAERNRIVDVRLYSGEIGGALLDLVAEQRIDLLVIGWHGRFMAGHAPVLKSLLAQVTSAVLLVKPRPRSGARLKVGEALTRS